MPSAHTTLWKACARLVARWWDSLWVCIHNWVEGRHALYTTWWKRARFLPTPSTTHSHRFPQVLPLPLPLAKAGLTHILHTAYYYHH